MAAIDQDELCNPSMQDALEFSSTWYESGSRPLGRVSRTERPVNFPHSTRFKQEAKQRTKWTPIQPATQARRENSKIHQGAPSAVSLPAPPPPPPPPPPPVLSQSPLGSQKDRVPKFEASYDEAIEKEDAEELNKKLILSLSMHFQDETIRERYLKVREMAMASGVEQRDLSKDPLGLPRSSTFRQEGEQPPQSTPMEPTARGRSLLKAKQGLVGFANGSDITAMADTGSRKNVISASYAKKLDLRIERLPSIFVIGNSRKIQSIGTASLYWTFADKPKESFPILCHVLPNCTYNLILGNSFLTATKTLTDFCHRLTKCLFRVVNNISHFSFLGETSQGLHGTLADKFPVRAIPDTGADRNVMSLQYALEHGLEIKTGPKHCGYLQFADGSYDLTVGQVKTHWTFASGERVPVTFEVLEYCCSDVVIGEEILTEHNVFRKHEASVFQTAAVDDDCFELAPFDFVNFWQKGCEKLMVKAGWRRGKDDYPRNEETSENVHFEEQHRRNVWNHKYDFGTQASIGEGELERARRERYEFLHGSSHFGPMEDQTSGRGNENQQPERRMPVIPSIPSSQTPW